MQNVCSPIVLQTLCGEKILSKVVELNGIEPSAS